MLSWFFAPKQTPKEMMNECQASLRQAVREIERAQEDLMEKAATREKEMKIYAKKGQIPTVKVMAKDLVRMRSSIARFYAIKAQLESTSTNLIVMQSTEAMAGAMRSTALAMQRMNRAQSLPALQKIIQTFSVEQNKMDNKQELMEGAMDDAFEQDEAEEDTLVNQVLDEIGIGVAERMGSAPSKGGDFAATALPPDMTKRLNELRK
jgi:charged multivesicular body protein 2A